MRYYKLSESFEKNKSAIIEGFDEGYFDLGKFQQGDLSYFEFPQVEVIFSGLHFKKGAVIVDFINTWGAYGGLGYLISERTKNIFENFNLPSHKFYKIPLLEFKGTKYQYYYMQILTNSYDYSFIDFEKSIFFKTYFFKENKELLKFKNSFELKEFFINMNDTEESIIYDKIFLNKNFTDSSVDMFYFDNLVHSFVINEKVYSEFIKHGITGVILEELSIFDSHQ